MVNRNNYMTFVVDCEESDMFSDPAQTPEGAETLGRILIVSAEQIL